MAYRLNPGRTAENPEIVIVGCGGTGGFVADHLCRLFTGRPAKIVLVDHDRVERHNVLRQNFTTGDIGKFKSETLAERLAQAYDRAISYSVLPFISREAGWDTPSRKALIIGCVDNAEARKEISKYITNNNSYYSYPAWWIDVGNGRNWGQILIGNTTDDNRLRNGFKKEHGICEYLPVPTIQRPDLLTTVPEGPPDTDCAAAMDLTDQDPTINAIMAMHTVQAVFRLVTGTCTYMSQYVNLEDASAVSNPALPENVARITGLDVSYLTEESEASDDERCNDETCDHEISDDGTSGENDENEPYDGRCLDCGDYH